MHQAVEAGGGQQRPAVRAGAECQPVHRVDGERGSGRVAGSKVPQPHRADVAGGGQHPDGGERTAAETQADEEQQRRQINRETAMGSLKHRRLPRWQHWIPKFVLFFDFVLLLYFFAGITNMNWQNPTALKFPVLWGLVSGFPGLVTVWLHVGRGGVTGCGGP